MDNLEFLLKLIIPGSCFLINIFCIAYTLGVNPSSKRNKSYIAYLIIVNIWIILDPLIFNFDLSDDMIGFIAKYRLIIPFSLGLLYINLIYKLIYKKLDNYFISYVFFYVISLFLILFTDLIYFDYKYVGWYLSTVPGKLLIISVLLVVVIPTIHSLYLLFHYIINSRSKIVKIQLSLLLIGSLLMLLIGALSDIALPYIFNYNKPIILGSTIMAPQVFLIMPALFKYDFLSLPIDSLITKIFKESNDAIVIIDNECNIINYNSRAKLILFSQKDIKELGKIENYIPNFDIHKNYSSYRINKNIQGKYLSVSTAPILKNKNRIAKMLLLNDITELVKYEIDIEKYKISLDRAQKISKMGTWEENHINTKMVWSNNCKRLLGFKDDDIINHELFWNRVHPEDKSWLKPLWNQMEDKGMEDKGMEDKGGQNESIYRIILDDGTIRYIKEICEFIYENDILIRTIGSVQDVTQNYLGQKELELSETRLKEAQQVAHIGSFDYDLLSEKVVWSDELYRIYGLEKEKYNPSNDGFFNLVHQNDRKMIREIIDIAINNHTLLEYDHRLIRSDNYDVRIMHCRAKITYNKKNNPIRIAGTSQDVTNIRKAEEEVKTSREQLRKLASHLQRAQEKERARISREIHDELGQELTGIKMDISWLSKSLKNPTSTVQNRILSLNKLIDTTINSVRRISSELRPGVLDDLGLIPAIEWYVEEFQNRTKIKCNFKFGEMKSNFESEMSTTFYRIVQESLTNVARHSKATEVIINLFSKDKKLILDIEDNGIGFDNDIINYEKSLGILGMEERVIILGGIFTILGRKNKGTNINVEIPYSIKI